MQDSSTSGIQLFEKGGWKLRTITDENGEPWFVAKDVCDALEIGNSRMALQRLDNDEKGVSSIDTPGGNQQVSVINEPGLYTLVLSSRKPEAHAFKRWVTHDVIPAIRRHGAYVTPRKAAELLADPDTLIELLQQLKSERSKVAELAPKAAYYDSAMSASGKIPVRDAAKLLRAYDPTMTEKRLRSMLRADGMVEQRTTKATARALERGYMVERQCVIRHSDGTEELRHYGTLTAKGLDWCRARYCKPAVEG